MYLGYDKSLLVGLLFIKKLNDYLSVSSFQHVFSIKIIKKPIYRRAKQAYKSTSKTNPTETGKQNKYRNIEWSKEISKQGKHSKSASQQS